jgi:hypothetical protein
MSGYINNREGNLFLQKCRELQETGGEGIRLLPTIYYDLVRLLSDSAHSPDVYSGMKLLYKIARRTKINQKNIPYFAFFSEKIRDIGGKLHIECLKNDDLIHKPASLSQENITYGAYVMAKASRGDVLAATRDTLLESTLIEVERIARPVFERETGITRKFYVVKTLRDLRYYLKVIGECRKIREEQRKELHAV